MKRRELNNLGIPYGPAMSVASQLADETVQSGMKKPALKTQLKRVASEPEKYTDDETFGELARTLQHAREARENYTGREKPAPCKVFGEGLDPAALEQIDNACRLPIAVRAALMPDAHKGYGLPIGGVLATEGAVIPYAVGVDIACRMKMTVLDLPVSALDQQQDRLANALQRETSFGVGSDFKKGRRLQHPVMDEDWSFSPIVAKLKDKAWAQLGTSGSGNHFAEYGLLTLEEPELGLDAGQYLALLSHSGSRGTGAEIANHFSKLARNAHPELPRELRHLSWLDLDSEPGGQYWQAMELMGRYAAANHQLIHERITQNLGVESLAGVENHHNFAWKEQHDGREVIVHRKGATPAREGVVGIIPGSMSTPGFVVRGRGNEESLNSAAHGAGRAMSRTEAKRRFTHQDLREFLARHDVKLLSAGLDEAPMAYKDIEEVMAAQRELVRPIARFDPRLVKMSP